MRRFILIFLIVSLSVTCPAAVLDSFNTGFFVGGLSYDPNLDQLWVLPLMSVDALHRYNKDGTLDQTFNVPGGLGGNE